MRTIQYSMTKGRTEILLNGRSVEEVVYRYALHSKTCFHEFSSRQAVAAAPRPAVFRVIYHRCWAETPFSLSIYLHSIYLYVFLSVSL